MKKILFVLLLLGIVLNSCKKDLLNKSPQDQISDPAFWKSDGDLQLYINNLYSQLPGWNVTGEGGTPLLDAGTDVAIATGLFQTTKNRLDGVINVSSTGGGWSWQNVRAANYFLDNIDRVPEGGKKNQYVGEGYFFRAWAYFVLLKQFGDLPIVTKALSTADHDILYGARSSRTDVVNFIVKDLDTAISKMGDKTTAGANRINRDVALAFEARVCLYEGTWEKYHANDAFKGTTDGTAFLTKAAQSAKAVMDGANYSLSTGDPHQAYYELFNKVKTELSNNPEVMLYRSYDRAAFGDDFGNEVWNWPNGSGITKDMVDMYLCFDGKPISLSPLYQGDHDIRQIVQNRDPRLVQTVMNPGDPVTISLTGDTTKFVVPQMINQQGDPTGYDSQKFRQPHLDPATGLYSTDLAYIIFRYAEVLLNYAEARAELGQLTQDDVDMTINKLRDRVGMPHLTLSSIAVDPAWPDYGYSLPDYLYEIRREREVELFSEGFRYDDLMRWRADRLFVGKRPKGAYYTAELKSAWPNLVTDANNYIDPYLNVLSGANGTWGFNPNKNYLMPIPTNELTLNPNLKQNPGW